jgi:hypothetical protein
MVMLTAGMLLAVFVIFPASESKSPRSSKSGISSGVVKGEEKCYPPNPPQSIEWTGRRTMTISFSEAQSAEVYLNDFPGSLLREYHDPRSGDFFSFVARRLHALICIRRANFDSIPE